MKNKKQTNGKQNKNEKEAYRQQRSDVQSDKDFKGHETGKSRRSSKNFTGRQGRKDSDSKRVNFDNARVNKVKKELKDSGKASNDVNWILGNPELIRSAGSIPFASITGTPLAFGGQSAANEQVPGILAFDWCYSLGGGVGAPISVNQCADSMYSFLVHANSRNYSYEASDLMMLVLAGSCLYSSIAQGIRVYGLMRTYFEQNAYMPDTLIRALGFQPDNIRQNLGQIWFDINSIIAQTEQIWIPNTLPVTERWFWLNSNVFYDAADPKAQMYVFKSHAFMAYDPTFSASGGGLKNINPNFENVLITWQQYKSYIQQMIDALVGDQDRGTIFGDILNAYGRDKIFTLPQIGADYRVEPVYNPEVMTEIENLTLGGAYITGFYQENNDIFQCYYPIIKANVISHQATYCPNTPIINFHDANQPSPEAVALATQFTVAGTDYVPCKVYTSTADASEAILTDGSSIIPISSGTEIITQVNMWTTREQTQATRLRMQLPKVPFNESDESYNEFVDLMRLMAFDWHPFVYVTDYLSSGETQGGEVEHAFGDYDNYTVANNAMLRKLHDACLYSYFGLNKI